MNIVVCGLSISSAWGNGHATLLRGLFKELHRLGHSIHFYERDEPYYAAHRDQWEFDYVSLHLYRDWQEARQQLLANLREADVAMITSYCPDGAAAAELLQSVHVPRTIFYDMDTPVTFSRLDAGEPVAYLPVDGLSSFDLVLSYTGGRALTELQSRLGAKRTAPLYGWVDPDLYYPSEKVHRFQSDLSYLGTYAADRQATLDKLFLQPARSHSEKRFLIGGAMYPNVQQLPNNVRFLDHVAPPDHRAFYCSSPLTLNVTRASMAGMGYCPSGRLFEAAACGTAIVSDSWDGLSEFFEPDSEILLAHTAADTTHALALDAETVAEIAQRARQRTLDCHTAAIRARTLLTLIESTTVNHTMQPELATSSSKQETN